MKPFRLPAPFPRLSKTALAVLACALVMRAEARAHPHRRNDRPMASDTRYSETWWVETKRMIERGYTHFCAVHKLDPHDRAWSSNDRLFERKEQP